MELDLMIRNGFVFDGLGNPPRRLDVGIRGDRIAWLGQGGEHTARRTLQADGLFVTPGFIDMHSHGDMLCFMEGKIRRAKIAQGITTDLSGQCGIGPAPMRPGMEAWRQYVAPVIGNPDTAGWDWPAFGDFLNEAKTRGTPHNTAYLVAHGAIRAAVLGLEARTARSRDLKKMQELLEQSLIQGAFGMSFGLSYLPGMFADPLETKALAEVLAAHDRILMVHIRSHSLEMREAVEEMIGTARETGVRLHISHLKSYRNRRYGLEGSVLREMVESAAREVDITFDEHPYLAGSTTLSQLLPPWAREGGAPAMIARIREPESRTRLLSELSDPDFTVSGWDNYWGIAGWSRIVVSSVEKDHNRWMENRSLPDLARTMGTTVQEALLKILEDEGSASCMVIRDLFSDDDLVTLMQSPLAMVGSDGIPTGTPHPRMFGTFPVFLRKLVKEHRALSWEDAVFRITGKSAARLGLKNRGVIREGFMADLVVFDPESLDAPEDYSRPEDPPRGIREVVVNGVTAGSGMEAGQILRAHPAENEMEE